MNRTHNNGELRLENVGQTVELKGWVAKKRNLGALVFIDLRDRYGITQIIINEEMENISKDIMHDDGVVNNCAYVSVITGPKNSSDGIAKHVNYFATTYGKYDDYKYSSISTRCRAGFYIDPELPTLEIELDQAYYRATLKKDASGKHKSYYSWDYNNTLIDDTTSKVLKYRVSMNNKKKNKDQGITDEDNATNPNITVALPYDENLDTNGYVKKALSLIVK